MDIQPGIPDNLLMIEQTKDNMRNGCNAITQIPIHNQRREFTVFRRPIKEKWAQILCFA
jgi:hypothetical protein